MHKVTKFVSKLAVSCALFIGLSAVLPDAKAQTFALSITNVAGGTTSNAISTVAIDIKPGKSLVVVPVFSASTDGGTNLILGLRMRVDRSLFATTDTLSLTNAFNGTNVVVGYASFTAAQMVGDQLVLYSANAIGTNTATHLIRVSYKWY